MSTFVTLGNAHQNFKRLLLAVIANLDSLPKPILVQHGYTPFSSKDCIASAFLSRNQFAEAVRSRVVICHAGAGSILECLWVGQKPIVMPRLQRYGEHIDDHQSDLASAFHRIGRVFRVDTAAELRTSVFQRLSEGQSVAGHQYSEPALIRVISDAIGQVGTS